MVPRDGADITFNPSESNFIGQTGLANSNTSKQLNQTVLLQDRNLVYDGFLRAGDENIPSIPVVAHIGVGQKLLEVQRVALGLCHDVYHHFHPWIRRCLVCPRNGNHVWLGYVFDRPDLDAGIRVLVEDIQLLLLSKILKHGC